MKCSKCGRDAKGHGKPLGEDCQMPEMSESEIEAMTIVDGQAEKPGADGNNKDMDVKDKTFHAASSESVKPVTSDSPVLDELASQMATINLTLQVLADGQAVLQREVSTNTKRLSSLPPQHTAPPAVNGQHPQYSLPPPAHTQPTPAATGHHPQYVLPHPAHIQPTAGATASMQQPLVYTLPTEGATSSMQPSQSPLSTPSIILPHMMHANPSADTKAKALRGEYIQLEDFAPDELLPPNPALEPFADSRGTLTLRPKRPKKVLDRFDKWLAAWSNYELLLVQNGYGYAQLAHHRATIQYANRKYYWSVIYAYDVKYRLACGEQHSLNFSQTVGDLYGSCFDAAALKPDAPRCKRCKSTNHMVGECPFPTGEAMEKKAPQATYQDRWYNGNQEGCNNWNAGKCHYSGCKRAHVCKGCRGPQPMQYCNTCRHTPQAQTGSLQGGAGGAR